MSANQQVLGGLGTSSADIGDNIAYSLMLDSASSQYLSFTPAGAGNRKTWVFSTWLKRGKITTDQAILYAYTADSDTGLFYIGINTSDQLFINLYTVALRISTRVFRDPAAWIHLYVALDTTQATAADRLKIYINGVEETAWGTNNAPTLNADCAVNGAFAHNLFRNVRNSNAWFDGYASETNFIGAGTSASQPATAFGRVSADTLQWVNKTYAGSYSGTNSFKLDFANSADLGNDVSGNNNDWTTNGGISSSNQYTDTPTNNYAVLNPLAKGSQVTGPVLGNTKISSWSSSAGHGILSTFPIPTTGKWKFEVTGAGVGCQIGIVNVTQAEPFLSSGVAGTYGYVGSNGHKVLNGTETADGTFTFTTTDIITVLYDADALTITYKKNNATPTSAFSVAAGTYTPSASYSGSTPGSPVFNFGARGFTYTDTGFSALCTVNLPTPAVVKSTNGFVASATAESSIYSQVAADVSGWSAYVQILKNRTSVESWVWTFSHNATREYAVSAGAATDQAVRAMSGADNWIGYSIRIGSTYGTAAGSVSHTNGADTTVTTGVTLSTRQMIFLFLRGSGTVVRIYHPDLTSGKLLDLCSFAAETTSSTIKTVTTTSFKIDTGTATGTYDYLVISELDGFAKLSSFTSNGAADGIFGFGGEKPALTFWKAKNTTGHWRFVDVARSTYNPAALELYTSFDSAEVATAIDLVSNGTKFRTASDGVGSTNTGVMVQLSGSPLKYATAR